MRLADNGDADDDLGDIDFEKIAEEKTVGIGSPRQFGIDGGKLVEKAVHPIAEMLIARSEQDEGDHQHEQGLHGVGVDHRIGAAEGHIAENEEDHRDQHGEFGDVEALGKDLHQSDQDEDNEGDQQQGEKGEKEGETLALVAGAHPLCHGQGFHRLAMLAEALGEQDQRDHRRRRQDQGVGDDGADAVVGDEPGIDDEGRRAGHRGGQGQADGGWRKDKAADRVIRDAFGFPGAADDKKESHCHVEQNDDPGRGHELGRGQSVQFNLHLLVLP